MLKYKDLLKRRFENEEGHVFYKKYFKYRIALVFPNTYKVGMSNLGFQLVYFLLNSEEDIFCERVFLPDYKDAEVLSIETCTPLNEFDLILFSIQTEFDYMNVLDILKRGGLELFKERRKETVMAGGIAVSYNPAVLSPFIDGFFLGEAETGVLDHLTEALPLLADKNAFLKFMAKHPNIYIPSIDGTVTKEVGRIHNLESETHTHIFTEETVFGDMFLLELVRGCEARCRFCIAGYFVKPFRPKPVELVKDALEWGVVFRKRVGLIGADVSNYPWMEEIYNIIKFYNLEVSFSSLRPKLDDEILFKIIRESGQKTVTVAPETGSERLRFLINKVHTNEEYLEFTERLVKDCGVKTVKLYFLIGLPSEEEEDLKAITDLLKRISSIRGLPEITASINHVVPKPFTPFQNYDIGSLEDVKMKVKTLEKIISRSGLKKKIRFHIEKPENTFIEYLLSVGDGSVGLLLKDVYERYGNIKRLAKIIKNVDKFRPIVSSGIKERYIEAHWNSYIKGREPWGDCRDGCKVCGLCKDPYISSNTLRVTYPVCN